MVVSERCANVRIVPVVDIAVFVIAIVSVGKAEAGSGEGPAQG